MEVVYIPRKLVREAEKRGIKIHDFIIKILANKLKLDPHDVATIRLELAEKFLREAKECIERDDAVQASEKLYKVAEECIKALAIKFNLPEAQEAYKVGGWWLKLLSRAAKTLSSKLNEPAINRGWCVAYDLHVWGFHEASLTVDHIKVSLVDIEQLFQKTCKLILNR